MRVFLPASRDDIEALINNQSLSGRTGFAMLPEWVGAQSEQDPEVLEEELVYLAAQTSLALGGRIALVAELEASILEPQNATVSVGEFGQRQILAMFGDDIANKKAILTGIDPADLDLTWFGPTEILDFRDFLVG